MKCLFLAALICSLLAAPNILHPYSVTITAKSTYTPPTTTGTGVLELYIRFPTVDFDYEQTINPTNTGPNALVLCENSIDSISRDEDRWFTYQIN